MITSTELKMDDQETRQQNPQEIKTTVEMLVTNMFQKCKFEAERNKLLIPLKDYDARVSYYTGITKMGLKQILNLGNTVDTKNTRSINIKKHMTILKCILQFYLRKETPTFRDLFDKLNELREEFKDFELFEQEARLLGFEYRTMTLNTELLMEDPTITFERMSYLKKIISFREKNTRIYYIGETLIDNNLDFNNPWKQNIDFSVFSGDVFVFVHVISRQGFTNGFFSHRLTADDFYKWVVDILLVTLEPSSVIVLDNCPLHGILQSKTISMYDTKHDMIEWLMKHDVPFSRAMNKFQLYELIKKHSVTEEMHPVDRLLKVNGHQVLRMPTNFEDLSPMNLLWNELLSKDKRLQSLLTSDTVKEDVYAVLEDVPEENFIFHENCIAKKELELYSIDTKTEDALEDFLIELQKRENKLTTCVD